MLSKLRRILCTTSLLIGVVLEGHAQQPVVAEYQLKAAFLLNFAKFIAWPAAAFPKPDSPLVIGILGDDPFEDFLKKTVQNRLANEHPIVLKQCSTLNEATNCHILFLSRSEKDRFAEDLQALAGLPILTVSESPEFLESGGTINFVAEGKKLRFEINETTARSAHLKVSSKLLALASKPPR